MSGTAVNALQVFSQTQSSQRPCEGGTGIPPAGRSKAEPGFETEQSASWVRVLNPYGVAPLWTGLQCSLSKLLGPFLRHCGHLTFTS